MVNLTHIKTIAKFILHSIVSGIVNGKLFIFSMGNPVEPASFPKLVNVN